jgi:hypothetical protein
MTDLDQPTTAPPCGRCGHPNAWHRHDDMVAAGEQGHGPHGMGHGGNPYAGCPFRCVGHDVWTPGPPPAYPCQCPDYLAPAA